MGPRAARLAVIPAQTAAYTPTEVGEANDDPRESVERSSAPLGAGSVLADRYRLLRRIGSGGMGSVWAAEHLALGSQVAIKLISPSLVHDERARARFLREARAAANLRSPHVVRIFDHGVHDGTPYIAMELLEGESLSARLARCGALAAERVVELMTQVGLAAAQAHAAGVVHRDLKPDNIYLVAEAHGEIAKVLDFGIAKRGAEPSLGSSTASGAMLGTPFYMSPEQLIDAGLADARADLWSLGVITYECLLGRRPFAAASMAELAVAVLAEPIPVPSSHGPVPLGFDEWFTRALQREPSARFRDATEMFDALAACMRAGDASRGVAGSQRSAHSPTKWVLPATLIGAATLAVIAFAGGPAPRGAEPPPAAVAVPPAAAETPAEPPRPLRDDVEVDLPTALPPSGSTSVGPPPEEVPTTSPRKRTGAKPIRKPSDPVGERPQKQDVRELEGL